MLITKKFSTALPLAWWRRYCAWLESGLHLIVDPYNYQIK